MAQLSSRAGPDAQCVAAARIREALCSRNPPVQALLDAGVAAPLVRLVKEGPAAARVDAAWAMVNIAASSEYAHAEALCNETATEVLVEVLGGGKQRQSNAGGSSSSGAASTSGSDSALAELSLWALGNIAGAMHPGMRTQALAVDVLDAGALRAVLTVMEREAAGASTSAPVASPLLRVATWCLHNLAKHKREKEMVGSVQGGRRGCGSVNVGAEALCSCQSQEKGDRPYTTIAERTVPCILVSMLADISLTLNP